MSVFMSLPASQQLSFCVVLLVSIEKTFFFTWEKEKHDETLHIDPLRSYGGKSDAEGKGNNLFAHFAGALPFTFHIC